MRCWVAAALFGSRGQLRLGGCQFPGKPLSISCRALTDGPVVAVRGPYPLTAHYSATLSAFRAVDDAGGNVAVLAMLNVGHHMVATESEVPSIEVLLALLPVRARRREQSGELLHLLRPHRRWRATKQQCGTREPLTDHRASRQSACRSRNLWLASSYSRFSDSDNFMRGYQSPRPSYMGSPQPRQGSPARAAQLRLRTFSLPPLIPLAATAVIRFGFEGRAQSTLGRSLALLLLRELGHGLHPSLHRVRRTTEESMLAWPPRCRLPVCR